MKDRAKIKHNRARCKRCGEKIESKHVHDWVCCACFIDGECGIFVDGGKEYLRRGGNMEDFIDLHEEHQEETK